MAPCWTNTLTIISGRPWCPRSIIAVHPDTQVFLQFLRDHNRKVALVTNAHYKTLDLKMNQTGLLGYFDAVISSFDLGRPKEEVGFWQMLQERLSFDRRHVLLVDDNVEVLAAARRFGIKYLFFKANPSSRLTSEKSPDFLSLLSFQELMV
jgi:HAD superfamily hydrolase (TIGR01509 family)